MWEPITELQFRDKFYTVLDNIKQKSFSFVAGPGRSGAIASVYASHYLSIPFKPHKTGNYTGDTSVLIVDTVEYTGNTLRKAASWYGKRGLYVTITFAFKESRGHYYKFWYENGHR